MAGNNEVEITVTTTDKTAPGLAAARSRTRKFGSEIKTTMAAAGQQAGAAYANGIRRGADGRFRDARGKFVKGFVPPPAAVDREGRGIGSRIARAIGRGIAGGVSGIASGLSKAAKMAGPVLIGVLGGLLVSAGPALGSALGAGIVAGLGAGLVGMGAMALLHVEEVNSEWSKAEQKRVKESNKQALRLRKQFTELKRDIVGGLRETAQPLVGVFDTVRSSVRDIGRHFKPTLTAAFASAKVPLQSFVREVRDGIKRLKPAVEPIMTAFTDILGAIDFKGFFGDLGASLTDLASTVSANKSIIGSVFDLLLGAIPFVINAVSGVINVFRFLLGVAMSVTVGISRGFAAVTDVVLGMVEKTLGVMRTVGEAISRIPGLGDFGRKMVAGLDSAIAKVGEWKEAAHGLNRKVELRAEIFDLTQKIDEAKAALDDPSLTKTRRAKLTADLTELMKRRGRAVALLGDPRLVKEYESRVTTDIRELRAKIRQAKRELASKDLTRERRSRLNADISRLRAKVRAAKAALASVRSRSVTISVNTIYNGTPSSRAAILAKNSATGGIIGGNSIRRFQNGGLAGGGSSLAMVGEQGPELVRLPFGASVTPAGQTRAMLTGGGGGGGGGPIHITLKIGETTLGELIVDPLRKAVRTRGGNVQAVLGRG